MDYLERNAKLLSEIHSTVGLGPRRLVDQGKSHRVSSIGSFHSITLDTQVFVALREPLGERSVDASFYSDLTAICWIYDNFSELRGELPLFYGISTDAHGRKGFITEDYSKNKVHPVEDVSEIGIWRWQELIPKQLLIGPLSEVDPYDLAKACFMVDGRRRMGDFDSLGISYHISRNPTLFRYLEIFETAQRFRVTLPL